MPWQSNRSLDFDHMGRIDSEVAFRIDLRVGVSKHRGVKVARFATDTISTSYPWCLWIYCTHYEAISVQLLENFLLTRNSNTRVFTVWFHVYDPVISLFRIGNKVLILVFIGLAVYSIFSSGFVVDEDYRFKCTICKYPVDKIRIQTVDIVDTHREIFHHLSLYPDCKIDACRAC